MLKLTANQKRLRHSYSYGGRLGKPSYPSKLTINEARKIIVKFNKEFPKLKEVMTNANYRTDFKEVEKGSA